MATKKPGKGRTVRGGTAKSLREYERYYTDRTVPEHNVSSRTRKRVIEERLVYTAFFDL